MINYQHFIHYTPILCRVQIPILLKYTDITLSIRILHQIIELLMSHE